MITILTKQRLKHNGDIFVEILPHSINHEIGRNYLLQDFQTWKPFHKVQIIDIRTKQRMDLTSFETLLNNNVDVNLHNEIDELRKPINLKEKLDVIVFKSIQNLNPICIA